MKINLDDLILSEELWTALHSLHEQICKDILSHKDDLDELRSGHAQADQRSLSAICRIFALIQKQTIIESIYPVQLACFSPNNEVSFSRLRHGSILVLFRRDEDKWLYIAAENDRLGSIDNAG